MKKQPNVRYHNIACFWFEEKIGLKYRIGYIVFLMLIILLYILLYIIGFFK